VFAASKQKKLLSVTNLGGPIYSTPVAANGVLYVHSNTHLFAFYDSEHKRMASDEKPKSNSTGGQTGEQQMMKKLLLLLLIWPVLP
jgi:hypothetical protein